MIAENLLIGRSRDEVRLGLRTFPVGNYLLIYRPVQDGIEIVRVLHGRGDIEQLFGD